MENHLFRKGYKIIFENSNSKVGRVFSMIIWSEFRMGQYRDEDHREDPSLASESVQNFQMTTASLWTFWSGLDQPMVVSN